MLLLSKATLTIFKLYYSDEFYWYREEDKPEETIATYPSQIT